MNMIDSTLAGRPVHPVLWATAATMVALELVFMAVDAGLLSPALSRVRAYTAFGYWDPLWEVAVHRGHVHPQLVWSPLTYAVLHGGLLHLLFNTAAFLGLGHAISTFAGIRAAATTFAVTAVAGALFFSVITDHNGPLVGASGVVFGYIGMLTAWQERALRHVGEDRTSIWQRILGLVAINALLDFGMGGMLAWEAHLGGFVAGWVMAYVYRPRRLRRGW